ncbi:MAG: hypothetical protein OEL55_06840, partial [Desulfobulbaceae bacterium]|nr:hypothetical protein [Desulfobulbaceae bacterium]
MRIAESNINLTATRLFHQEQHTEESLEAWVGEERPEPKDRKPNLRGINGPLATDTIHLSTKGLAARAAAHRARHQIPPVKVEEAEPEKKKYIDAKLEAMRVTIEMLTGKKIKISDFSPEAPDTPEVQQPTQEGSPPQKVGWG